MYVEDHVTSGKTFFDTVPMTNGCGQKAAARAGTSTLVEPPHIHPKSQTVARGRLAVLSSFPQSFGRPLAKERSQGTKRNLNPEPETQRRSEANARKET